jgi:hypothetical protein
MRQQHNDQTQQGTLRVLKELGFHGDSPLAREDIKDTPLSFFEETGLGGAL